MGVRFAEVILLSVLAGLPACDGAEIEEAVPPQVLADRHLRALFPDGDRADDELRALSSDPAPAGPIILWVFRTEDWVACQDFAYELRQVQRSAELNVSTTILHVGASRDTLIIRPMLSRDRLGGELVSLEAQRYEQLFGDAPTPAWYLLRDGRIEAARSIPAVEASSSVAEVLARGAKTQH